ncbi:MAG: aminotransferase class V-fold PLP-dependent enzyme, partial [Caldisericia bacterium]|nr:aminotransferase class V-fold PLP-dependent enzyme [Caldisericia bacterium]
RAIKGAQVNGHPQNRLYNTLNVSFPHAQTETLIISLDFKGICVSGGSACASGSGQASYVLNAMGLPEVRVRSALRFSLSKYTKTSDITKTIEEIKHVVKRLQSLSSSWNS